MKRTTMKDVAEAAKVSIASVSQALRPREGSNIKLQEKKVELIRAAAKKLNYIPHSGARSIRSQRFGAIGYFAPKATNLVFTPYGYQHGVHDALAENDYRITLIRVSNQIDQAREQIPSAFRELNLDALIVESYGDLARKIYEIYNGLDFPFLYLNDRHDVCSVFVDDIKGAAILTRHALAKGYRKVGFVHRQVRGEATVENMHHSAVDRAKGYERTMRAEGLEPIVQMLEADAVLGRNVMIDETQWPKLKDLDAVIAYDDDLANSIARFCYRKGIRIPEDIGLAGFNGDYASLSAWRPLTTMKIPTYEMGLAIGRMAVDRLKGTKEQSTPSIQFVPTLIEGETL